MALDPNIALGVQPLRIENPMNQLGQLLQVQNAQRQNELGAMQLEQTRQDRASMNALNDAYRGATGVDGSLDRNALLQRLAQGGQGSRIPALQEQFAKIDKEGLLTKKADTDIRKTELEIAEAETKAKRDAIDRHLQMGGMVRTPQDFQAWVNQGLQSGLFDMQKATALLQNTPADPQALAAEVQRIQMGGLPLKEQLDAQLAQIMEISNGQQKQFIDRNPRSPTFGKPVLPTVQMQASPEAVMTDNRVRSEGALNRGVQLRGQNMVDQRAREGNRLKAEEIAANRESGLPVLGVPVPTVTPWSNQSTPRDANKVKAAEIARGGKEVEKDIEAASAAQKAADQAKRFMELNKKVNTGGITDKFGAGQFVQSLSSDYASMQEITASLAPNMRPAGAGATSDYDAKQYERATVGVDKPKATNDNIARSIVARAQQSADYAEFRQTYLEQNGTLQGADRYWKQYVEKNPIFNPDPKKAANFELNPARKPWRDHFKNVQPAQPKPANDGWSVEVIK